MSFAMWNTTASVILFHLTAVSLYGTPHENDVASVTCIGVGGVFSFSWAAHRATHCSHSLKISCAAVFRSHGFQTHSTMRSGLLFVCNCEAIPLPDDRLALSPFPNKILTASCQWRRHVILAFRRLLRKPGCTQYRDTQESRTMIILIKGKLILRFSFFFFNIDLAKKSDFNLKLIYRAALIAVYEKFIS